MDDSTKEEFANQVAGLRRQLAAMQGRIQELEHRDTRDDAASTAVQEDEGKYRLFIETADGGAFCLVRGNY